MTIYSIFQSPLEKTYIQCDSQWLSEYFNGQMPDPNSLPVKLNGTFFQESVWNALLKIPYGQTTTYKEIAVLSGNPRASQAVGNAVGRNPISIIIPCHRVLGRNNSLIGYAEGLKYLLTLEHTV